MGKNRAQKKQPGKLYLPILSNKGTTFLLPALVPMEDETLLPDLQCTIVHLFTSPLIGKEILNEMPFPISWKKLTPEDAIFNALIGFSDSGAGLLRLDKLFFPLDDFGLEHCIAMGLPFRTIQEGKSLLIERLSEIYQMSRGELLRTMGTLFPSPETKLPETENVSLSNPDPLPPEGRFLVKVQVPCSELYFLVYNEDQSVYFFLTDPEVSQKLFFTLGKEKIAFFWTYINEKGECQIDTDQIGPDQAW